MGMVERTKIRYDRVVSALQALVSRKPGSKNKVAAFWQPDEKTGKPAPSCFVGYLLADLGLDLNQVGSSVGVADAYEDFIELGFSPKAIRLLQAAQEAADAGADDLEWEQRPTWEEALAKAVKEEPASRQAVPA